MDKNKLRYAILKEIDSVDGLTDAEFTPETFGISEKEFEKELTYLQSNNFVVSIIWWDGKPQLFSEATLTEKGETYLSENSTLAKTYKVAKELRDWLK